MNAGESNDVPLSDAAAKRRDAILADALRVADRRRRARVMRHAAGVACACCVLAVGTFVILNRIVRWPVQPAPLVQESPQTIPSHGPDQIPSTVPDEPRVVVQIIPADRVERHWQVIDDEQLIAAMADAGKPAGVARLNGRAVVVPLQ